MQLPMQLRLFPDPDETIDGARQDIARRRRSCRDVVQACLDRIDQFESQIRAWVSVDRAGALEQADALDEELRRRPARGPLHGVPVGVKDIIDVAGWPTAAGSKEWSTRKVAADATIVARLRRAGAIILGKTVTTQYASFDPSVTRNPWNLARTAGGSSSGSAAAVAAGMCLAALGSQTGGSITRPATYCGVAGCKPTYGRVSLAGLVPLAPSMDHPGPIARTVRDLGYVLDVISGPDERDPRTVAEPHRSIVASLDDLTLASPRLGRVDRMFETLATPSVREATGAALEKLGRFAARVVVTALPESFDGILAAHRAIMCYEAAQFHRERLQERPDDYLPKIRAVIEEGLGIRLDDYQRARKLQGVLKTEINACFRGVDALVTSSTVDPAPDNSTTGDPAFNSPWSFLGLPTISFPVSLSADGLPLGLQLIGKPFDEPGLFRVAQWSQEVIRREFRQRT
jgi:aspartyl-tRNA(Asn)/glutamyl-tRNA(Gln) amidotransferase subunit A